MRSWLRVIGTGLANLWSLGAYSGVAMSMPASLKSQTICGSIESIDLLSRELCICGESDRLSIYVPPACPISLNGDSVRMRLMQPGDAVEIVAQSTNSGWTAESIEIRRPFEWSSNAPSMSASPK